MGKFSESIKKVLTEKKIEGDDLNTIMESLTGIEKEIEDKDTKIRELETELESNKKNNADVNSLNEKISKLEKDNVDLKLKYIDTFENGKKPVITDKAEDLNSNPDITIDDLIEND